MQNILTNRLPMTAPILGAALTLMVSMSPAAGSLELNHLVGGVSTGCGMAYGFGTGLGIGALWAGLTGVGVPVAGVLGTASLLIVGIAAAVC